MFVLLNFLGILERQDETLEIMKLSSSLCVCERDTKVCVSQVRYTVLVKGWYSRKPSQAAFMVCMCVRVYVCACGGLWG